MSVWQDHLIETALHMDPQEAAETTQGGGADRQDGRNQPGRVGGDVGEGAAGQSVHARI